MAHDSIATIRRVSVLAAIAAALTGCTAMEPPNVQGTAAERPVPGRLPPAVFTGELGQLPVVITSQMSDGRNIMFRGLIKNPYPETVDGVRVLCRILTHTGPDAREVDRFQKTMDVHLDKGAQTALRWDVQTMYGGQGGFVLEAYAVKLGRETLPPPTDWRE